MSAFRIFKRTSVLMFILVLLLSGSSCRKDDSGGKVTFGFTHSVNGTQLVKDSLMYINTAGNLYEVNELQYFVSDVMLWKGGSANSILSDSAIHYVDIDIPSTLEWSPEQVMPAGDYDSLTFTFGLGKEKNVSGYFVNPPERDMFWPEMMGGGYHFIKMNGKWKTPQGEINPFNLHLGTSMMTDTLGNEVKILNNFHVCIPLITCSIHDNQASRKFTLEMKINSWFDTPNLWDWNVIGGQIMMNQDAMHMAAENGKDVFSISYNASLSK